jgi:hypothetical protein
VGTRSCQVGKNANTKCATSSNFYPSRLVPVVTAYNQQVRTAMVQAEQGLIRKLGSLGNKRMTACRSTSTQLCQATRCGTSDERFTCLPESVPVAEFSSICSLFYFYELAHVQTLVLDTLLTALIEI